MYNLLKIESLRAELRGEFDYSDLLRDMAVDEVVDSTEYNSILKFSGWEENWKEIWESRFDDRVTMYMSKHT